MSNDAEEEISASEDESDGDQNLSSARYDAAWFAKLNDLKNYKKKLGHCNIPVNESSLGFWTKTQRKCYNYDSKAFRPDRFEELKRIGFHFKLRYTLDEVRNINFQLTF